MIVGKAYEIKMSKKKEHEVERKEKWERIMKGGQMTKEQIEKLVTISKNRNKKRKMMKIKKKFENFKIETFQEMKEKGMKEEEDER